MIESNDAYQQCIVVFAALAELTPCQRGEKWEQAREIQQQQIDASVAQLVHFACGQF
jgi:hypothetical protein